MRAYHPHPTIEHLSWDIDRLLRWVPKDWGDGFIFGETMPTAENCGAITPKAQMRVEPETVTITADDTTIMGTYYAKGVVIRANRVRLEDCWISNNPAGAAGTITPGFNWYLRRPFTGWTDPANLTIEQHADSAGVTESALKILLTGSDWNEAIWSVCTEPGYDSGFSQQYGYFEARICFPDSAVAPDGTQLPDITNKGCPAWWTMGRRHVTYRDLKDVNGSAAASWFELDILEYMDNLSQDSNVGNKMVGSVHDWRRADRTIYNADQGLHNGSDNNSPDRIGDTAEWHNYGCLWTPGMVRWYLDGKPQHFLRYSNGMAPEPNGNSLPTGTFAIADADTAGVALCLGSGLNYPMWVSKVQVWG